MNENEAAVLIVMFIVSGLLGACVIICACMSNAPVRRSDKPKEGGNNKHNGNFS